MLAQLGRGYDKSDAIAAEMLAALNGNVQAERNMAMWFLAGTGVPIDVLLTAATMSGTPRSAATYWRRNSHANRKSI